MITRFWRSTFGLVALVALVLSVATLAIGFIAFDVTHEALELQLDHRIAVETNALLAEAHDDGFAGLINAVHRREAARSTASLEYLLLDDQGRRIAGGVLATAAIRPGYTEFFRYVREGRRGVGQSLTTPVRGGTLVVVADRQGLQEIDRTLVSLFAGTLAAMLLIGIGGAALIGWRTRLRLAHIDATALAIIDGDLGRRVPRDGSGSEFDNLAGTLNRMLDRIASLMDNLRQVSSDIAHDLRTPLTRLCSRIDQALVEADAEARVNQIEAARAEAGELLEIFAALLRIAEIEGMAERLPLRPIDLGTLLEQMVETYVPDAEASQHRLSSAITPGLWIKGDRRLLCQAVSNLLDNCLRHSPAGTNVMISAAPTADGAVRIAIADNGPGAPLADTRQLLQRFYRSEAARSTPGNGLGLALVAAIVAAHGGHIEIQADKGFCVTICLTAIPREAVRTGE
ncbi:MAG: HAMP domain-containing histidine kinase [Sphingomonadales bacterium]|nr:HAMP domain-containing histidine kinase [Sphingomonadales bacterium]